MPRPRYALGGTRMQLAPSVKVVSRTMRLMRSSDAAHALGCNPSQISRLAYRLGLTQPIGQGSAHRFTPGDVLALMVFRALDSHDRYADGARQAGWALDAGATPAYLITRGGEEHLVVLESAEPGPDLLLADLLLQASDAGAAVKVIRLRPMVDALEPWVRELQDA